MQPLLEIPEHSPPPKEIWCLLVTAHTPPGPGSHPSIYCLSLWICLFGAFPINAIIQLVAFGVWLLSQSAKSLRPILTAAACQSTTPSKTRLYSTVWKDRVLFPVDGTGCLHFLAPWAFIGEKHMPWGGPLAGRHGRAGERKPLRSPVPLGSRSTEGWHFGQLGCKHLSWGTCDAVYLSLLFRGHRPGQSSSGRVLGIAT